MADQAMSRWERTLRKMALSLVVALNKVYGSIGGALYTAPGQAPRRGAAGHAKQHRRTSKRIVQHEPARKRHARESHSNRG